MMGQTKPFESVPQMMDRHLTRGAIALGCTTIALVLAWGKTATPPSEDVLKTATNCIIDKDNNGTITHAVLKMPNNPDYTIPLQPRTMMNGRDTLGIAPGFRLKNQIGTYDHKIGYQPALLSCIFHGRSLTAQNSSGDYYHGRYEDGRVIYDINRPQIELLAQN